MQYEIASILDGRSLVNILPGNEVSEEVILVEHAASPEGHSIFNNELVFKSHGLSLDDLRDNDEQVCLKLAPVGR